MELMENEPEITWPFKMYDLIFRMNNTRKIAIMYGLKGFPKDKIEEYEKESSLTNTLENPTMAFKGVRIS